MQRLCLAKLAGLGGGWAAGLDGLFEGSNLTAMGQTKEEAIGNLVLMSPASFGIEIEEDEPEENKKVK